MSVEGFDQAATAFADLVHRLPADAWDGPGLGEWDLRSLVGHTCRALITVEAYLDQPADDIRYATPEAYYAGAAGAAGADPRAVLERGRAAGRAMGADPVVFVDALVARVPPLVRRDDDPVITTVAGGMRLSTYLPTRTLELVVHSRDIARATGVAAPAVPDGVLADVVGMLARVSVLRGRGSELLDALTGRAALPPGFSLV